MSTHARQLMCPALGVGGGSREGGWGGGRLARGWEVGRVGMYVVWFVHCTAQRHSFITISCCSSRGARAYNQGPGKIHVAAGMLRSAYDRK